MTRFIFIIFSVVLLCCHVDAANILGLFPVTVRSHHMVYEPYLKRLAERGHNMTVASFFPVKEPPPNFHGISLQGIDETRLEQVNLSAFENQRLLYKIPVLGGIAKGIIPLQSFATSSARICERLIDFEPFIEALKGDYDLVLMENFMGDCALALYRLYGGKAPLLDIMSGTPMPWTVQRIGAVDNPSYVPVITSSFKSEMSFMERLENTLLNICINEWFKQQITMKEKKILEKRFGSIPDLNELARNTSMIFLNTFHVLNGAIPLVPGLVEVGGMHLSPSTKSLPQSEVDLMVEPKHSHASAMTRFIFNILSVVLLCCYVEAANILGLFPTTVRSHHMVYEPYLKGLAERGHNMTVASFFPIKDPPPNIREISLQGIDETRLEHVNLNAFENQGFLYKIPVLGGIAKSILPLQSFSTSSARICERLMDLQPFVEALKGDYDLVLTEIFMGDCALALYRLYGGKAPILAMVSGARMPWTMERIGAVDNPSYVPIVTSTFKPEMSFMERLENTLLDICINEWYKQQIVMKEQRVLEKRFGNIPDLNELARNTSMIFLNTFHVLNGAMPLVPGLVEIGGMHLNIGKKSLPQYIEKFLNESEHGVVLFSLGSHVKTMSMPKYKEQIFINALSKLKQRVIWKYEGSGEEGTYIGNILRVKWLPQYELLQHKKVIAFITHGGMLGMTEAVSEGKPMVILPLFADQHLNAAAAAEAGAAVVLSYVDLTEQSLTNALQHVLSEEYGILGMTKAVLGGKPMVILPLFADQHLNAAAAAEAGAAVVLSYVDLTEQSLTNALQHVLSEEMVAKARKVSQMWHDRESSPIDTAIYHTERLIRWGHDAKLYTKARDLPFYKLALIDVALAIILFIVIFIALSIYLIKKILKLIIGKTKVKAE
ncbi:uncharacterized protein LOC112058476 [Bicyclus anynana]|uniref:Uncharacterized protein LOC112058476 n=1 Tax=Bicyclus anynana TaxID=110368 RepID=A0ABM3LKE0_BICAN|nr:uncharacterized protein LOC112058476 [Bicyclus anynana]